MPKKQKKEGSKKPKQEKQAGIKLDQALELILSPKNKKTNNDSQAKPSEKSKENKTEKKEAKEVQKPKESQLENKVDIKQLNVLDKNIPQVSPEPTTPVIREIPPQTIINYDNNPQPTEQERRYRETVQTRPSAPAIAPAKEEQERVPYTTRVLYAPQKTDKESVYTLQEKSMQMSNILSDRAPLRRIQERNPINNQPRETRTNSSHEEYTVDLESEQPKKPKRRYPWEA